MNTTACYYTVLGNSGKFRSFVLDTEVKYLQKTVNLTPFSNFQHLGFTINQFNIIRSLTLIGMGTIYLTKLRHQNSREDRQSD